MELKERMNKLKGLALGRIEKAAKKSDTQSVIAHSRTVEEIERLSNILDDIYVKVDSLEERIMNQHQKKYEQPSSGSDHVALSSSLASYVKDSPRVRGLARRKEFINSIKRAGSTLIHQSGAMYLTDSGGLVGIAYASERQPDRWFLGLPDKDYIAVVLICERDDGEMMNFILPGDFFHTHRHNFSLVKGQIKFNIVHRGNNYMMTIPKAGNIKINQFLNNISSLQR